MPCDVAAHSCKLQGRSWAWSWCWSRYADGSVQSPDPCALASSGATEQVAHVLATARPRPLQTRPRGVGAS